MADTPAVIGRRHLVLVRLAGAACVVLACVNVGLALGDALRAAVLLFVMLWPLGRLAGAHLLTGRLTRGERRVLELLAGYAAFSALTFAAVRLRLEALLPWLLGGGALLAVIEWRRAAAEERAAPARTPPAVACALWLAVPLTLLVLTRGNRAFVPAEDGSVIFNHSIDHSWHLAMYAELDRGVPAEQVPVTAGLAFPSYHVLGFMPGLFLSRWGGVDVVDFYFGVHPLLKLSLLAGALYLAVRLRTGSAWLAAAAVPFTLVLVHAAEAALYGRGVDVTTTVYFLLRSESGGSGLVVWGLVLALLAGVRGEGGAGNRRTLLAAALVAGLSFGFKAQVFLLLGAALAVAWVARALAADPSRAGERWRLGLASLVLMSAAAAFAFAGAWRPGSLGALHVEPGLLVEQYVYPVLARDPWPALRHLGVFFAELPAGAGALLLVPIVLWRLVVFSPFVPVFVARRALALGRVPLADAVAAAAFVLALPFCHLFALVSIEREASPFEFLQASHALSLVGAVVTLVACGELAGRRRREPGPAVLGIVLALSTVVGLGLAREAAFVPPRAAVVLGPDEQCALLWLDQNAAPDAVVASARSDADPARRGGRLNHQAVWSGFARRRAVFEYHPPQVDPAGDRPFDVRRLFRTRKERVAREILERYRIDYVVEYAATPLHVAPPFLSLTFQGGGVKVWRYERGTAPYGATPASPRPRGGLRCP